MGCMHGCVLWLCFPSVVLNEVSSLLLVMSLSTLEIALHRSQDPSCFNYLLSVSSLSQGIAGGSNKLYPLPCHLCPEPKEREAGVASKIKTKFYYCKQTNKKLPKNWFWRKWLGSVSIIGFWNPRICQAPIRAQSGLETDLPAQGLHQCEETEVCSCWPLAPKSKEARGSAMGLAGQVSSFLRVTSGCTSPQLHPNYISPHVLVEKNTSS
jgi:hypothetical protein